MEKYRIMEKNPLHPLYIRPREKNIMTLLEEKIERLCAQLYLTNTNHLQIITLNKVTIAVNYYITSIKRYPLMSLAMGSYYNHRHVHKRQIEIHGLGDNTEKFFNTVLDKVSFLVFEVIDFPNGETCGENNLDKTINLVFRALGNESKPLSVHSSEDSEDEDSEEENREKETENVCISDID